MTDVENAQPVAVLGLGNMGAALAEALLSAGFSVIVWNRTPDKLAALAERGAISARCAAEAVQATLEVWADTYAKSLSLCRTLGVDDTLPTALMNNFQKAIDHGFGDKEITAVFEVLLPRSG